MISARWLGRAQSPGRINIKCAHLRDVIQQAYGRRSFNILRDQVAGGPGWIDSDFYDIVAKADGEASMAQMTGPMMQALLEDRFRLKIHRDAKEVPVYELTVGKGGPEASVGARWKLRCAGPGSPSRSASGRTGSDPDLRNPPSGRTTRLRCLRRNDGRPV